MESDDDGSKFQISPSTGAVTSILNFKGRAGLRDADRRRRHRHEQHLRREGEGGPTTGGLSRRATRFTVTVTNVNEPPDVQRRRSLPPSADFAENTATTETVADLRDATDVDALTTLTFSLELADATTAANLTIDPSTGVLTFKNPPRLRSLAELRWPSRHRHEQHLRHVRSKFRDNGSPRLQETNHLLIESR